MAAKRKARKSKLGSMHHVKAKESGDTSVTLSVCRELKIMREDLRKRLANTTDNDARRRIEDLLSPQSKGSKWFFSECSARLAKHR